MMKNILNWIVKSSADPTKTSLTLKMGIPFVIIVVGWFGYGSSELEPLLSELINTIANVLAMIGLVISGAYSIFGFGRKIYYLFAK